MADNPVQDINWPANQWSALGINWLANQSSALGITWLANLWSASATSHNRTCDASDEKWAWHCCWRLFTKPFQAPLRTLFRPEDGLGNTKHIHAPAHNLHNSGMFLCRTAKCLATGWHIVEEVLNLQNPHQKLCMEQNWSSLQTHTHTGTTKKKSVYYTVWVNVNMMVMEVKRAL